MARDITIDGQAHSQTIDDETIIFGPVAGR